MITVPNLLAQQTEDMVEAQRIIFIREAAIRIYASRQDMDSRDAWRAAKWLWEVKPEDC